jgi:hypothetical protein
MKHGRLVIFVIATSAALSVPVLQAQQGGSNGSTLFTTVP